MDSAVTSIGNDLFGGSSSENPAESSNTVDVSTKEVTTSPAPAPAPVEASAPAPAAETTAPAPAPAETPAPAPASEWVPRTWRKEAMAHWGALPPEVRAEIEKRENDIFKGIEAYKPNAEIGRAVLQTLEPFAETIKKTGVHPLKYVEGILQVDNILRKGSAEEKAAVWAKLAENYGMSGVALPEPAYVDPQVKSLQSELQEVKSRLTSRESAEAEAARQTLKTEIDKFASDPANAYFDEVASDMAALLQSGTAKSLADAYEKAVWANPITRGKEQARLSAETAAKKAAEDAKKASEAAKAKAASVKSGTHPGGKPVKGQTMDETLAETLKDINSRK